jgi:hypothetical protein
MPLSYRIDTEMGIVMITGDYADADAWRRLLASIASDPDYRKGLGFLRDLRASEHPVTAETVVGIIAVVREFWDHLGVPRAAIVTRRGINDPALIAHALADAEHIPLRAFSSWDDAVKWLQGE